MAEKATPGVVDVVSTVKQLINEYDIGKQKEAALVVRRVEEIADNFLTSCDRDYSDNVTLVTIPWHIATLLNRLRLSQDPADVQTFQILTERSAELMTVAPLDAKEHIVKTMEDVIATIGTSRSSK